MFCSNCGAKARGNFCSACGEPLATAERPRMVETETETETESDAGNWREETRYEALLRVPEVRERIDRHAAMAGKRFSAEEFLAICDKLVPLGVPMGKLAAPAQSLGARLGIKTGKQRSEALDAPPGAVIVAVLRSFAQRGWPLRQTQQFDNGCRLEAAIPSDLRALEGFLQVDIRQEGPQTRVDATATIPGQWVDWGKCKACLATLFDDLKAWDD